MEANTNFLISDPVYRIESHIGTGGGGTVYKAWHTRLEKHVVIKELQNGSGKTTETQRNEVEALKHVKSPHLPQVLDFISENGRIFTVMEFIEGESFDKLLSAGIPYPQDQVAAWFLQLTSALEEIHRHGIYHRDIKPANIMLMPSGDVCLIDFNAALVSGNDVQFVSCSPGYASPEQLSLFLARRAAKQAQPLPQVTSSAADSDITKLSESDTDQTVLLHPHSVPAAPTADLQIRDTVDWVRSDIYSLGLSIYHMLTGIRPPTDPADLIPIEKTGTYGEALQSILNRTLASDPAERFPNAAALSHALRNIRRYDSRWKRLQLQKITAAILLPLCFGISAAAAIHGTRVTAQEKEEQYYDAVYAITTAAEPDAAYTQALTLYDDRIDAYRAMAERLWNDGDITALCTYLESVRGVLAKFSADPASARTFGDLYYILGNAYYYRSDAADMTVVRDCFAVALEHVKDNPAYYRDYAIALARCGDTQAAAQVLTEAEKTLADSASLAMISGEIAYAEKRYDDALGDFRRVLSDTEDDLLRCRALFAADDICRHQKQYDISVRLLSTECSRVPLFRKTEADKRLAEAYMQSGDEANAIRILTEVHENGLPQYSVMQNLVLLHQNAKNFDAAKNLLDEMQQVFPDDYRVPMRYAYFHLDAQSQLPADKRDFSAVQICYDAAKELFDRNTKPGTADAELQQLAALIDELRDNNWLS